MKPVQSMPLLIRAGKFTLLAVLLVFAGWFGLTPALAQAQLHQAQPQTPKNIIILFADGAAATQFEFGRYSSEILRGQPFAVTSELMRHGVMGLMARWRGEGHLNDLLVKGAPA